MKRDETVTLHIKLAAARINRLQRDLVRARRLQRAALEERAAIGGYQPADCGTPSGYQRHRRDKEQPCYACQSAHNWLKMRGKRETH